MKTARLMFLVFLFLCAILALICSVRDAAGIKMPDPTPQVTVTPQLETLVYETQAPEETQEPEVVAPEPTPKPWTDEEAEVLAKMLFGEAVGVKSKTEQAAVIWCALNRVDAQMFGTNIIECVTYPYQFAGYYPSNPVTDELLSLTEDVLERWYREKAGESDVGRVLPADYFWFHGDGKQNHFRNEYESSITWDWSLTSPYES